VISDHKVGDYGGHSVAIVVICHIIAKHPHETPIIV